MTALLDKAFELQERGLDQPDRPSVLARRAGALSRAARDSAASRSCKASCTAADDHAGGRGAAAAAAEPNQMS